MATASQQQVGPDPDGAGGSTAVAAELPRERTCAATARRLLEDNLGAKLEPEMLDDLKTILSELVNNAYEHGRGRIQVKAQRGEHRIRLEVLDEGENASIAIRPNAFDGRGNGLRIVDLLADNWGVFHGTSHVWATVSLTPVAPAN
jgi:anti-sigma regulatory factor (Ser/Thr protein kinase)